jgi:hypothetical protein
MLILDCPEKRGNKKSKPAATIFSFECSTTLFPFLFYLWWWNILSKENIAAGYAAVLHFPYLFFLFSFHWPALTFPIYRLLASKKSK